MLELKVFIFRIDTYIMGFCTKSFWVGDVYTYARNAGIRAWGADGIGIVNGLEI